MLFVCARHGSMYFMFIIYCLYAQVGSVGLQRLNNPISVIELNLGNLITEPALLIIKFH